MELQKRLKDLEDKSLVFEKRLKEFSVCQRDLLSYRTELTECRTELLDCKEELTTCREDLASCHKQLDENKDKIKEMEKKLGGNQSKIGEVEEGPTPQGDWMVNKILKSQDLRMDSLQKEINYVKETTERLAQLQRLFKSSIFNSQRPPRASFQARQSDGTEPLPDTQDKLTLASGVQHGTGGGCLVKGLEDWCYVLLSHCSPLPSKTWIQLVEVAFVHEPSTPFNRHTAKFRARQTGLYGMFVWFRQCGDGEVGVWVCGTGKWFSYGVEPVAISTSDLPADSNTLVRPMEEGDECWMRAKALKGRPGVLRCHFCVFLIGAQKKNNIDNN